ncbi:hypothetical protein QFZ29_003201 [Agromyces albus]|nr:hypothetical protein [Agromyces albus]
MTIGIIALQTGSDAPGDRNLGVTVVPGTLRQHGR